MPLSPGTSQETISDSISKSLESEIFVPGKTKKKRRQIAAAAALQKRGESLTQAALKRRK